MKKTVFLFIAAFLLIASTAMASTLFNFSFNSPDINGTGQLTATDLGGGVFAVTAGSVSTTEGFFSLVPNPNTPPNQATSPLGLFYYDNALYSLTPFVDNNGLLFFDSSINTELNIFSNGNLYAVWTGTPGGWPIQDNTGATFTAAVPEPLSVLMLGAGLVGIAAMRRKAKK